MRTVAVTMVKDEEDIIEATVQNMLLQVDHVIVADNMSTDATRDILDEIDTDRLTVVEDDEIGYYQSAKMTSLANRARLEHGADWIVPFDADEFWYSPFGRIADVLAKVPGQFYVVPAALYDHVATGIDPDEPDPVRRIAWRRTKPAPLPKVACRWRGDLRVEQGNHDATYGTPVKRFDSSLVIRHFPHRSLEHLLKKVRNGARAYAAVGEALPSTTGLHWRQWGKLLEERGEDSISELFHTWYWRLDPTVEIDIQGEPQPALIYDPAIEARDAALQSG